VVTFDNRGTGDTDKPDITYTMAMMADDVSGLLDALDIEAAHVYGVSMGGMIAQEFTLRVPEQGHKPRPGGAPPAAGATAFPPAPKSPPTFSMPTG